MNKRLVFILGGSIFLLVLIIIGILGYDNYLHGLEDLRRPNDLGSYYRNSGYFKFNPETVLESLESGDTNIFTPLPEEDALDLEELTDLSIYWTQADFLNIASAMGQFVWDDPMDLKEWSVYSLDFTGNCGDLLGFDSANITYFKKGRDSYTTRLIEIEPRFGWARWGEGEAYHKPILRKWKGVNLLRSKITADDALRIVNEDIKLHFQIKNNICGVMMGSSRYDSKNWNLLIIRGAINPIRYIVNFDTGDYRISNK
jgi:hypothetical protein